MYNLKILDDYNSRMYEYCGFNKLLSININIKQDQSVITIAY